MKKLLISLVMVSFLISVPKKIEEKQIGRYQLSTTTYENPKTSKVYIVETIIDTKTGEIVKRHRFYYKNYKKEWKKK
tara:strand:+ start:129 stop:359 length:231 start_codon:yes stop_codon:yes gene_type:complete